MHIYDITAPLSPSLLVYPGDPEVTITPIAQLQWGDAANVSRLVLSSHTGTHLDAPRHFFEEGMAIDDLDLRLLMGPARVCAFPMRRRTLLLMTCALWGWPVSSVSCCKHPMQRYGRKQASRPIISHSQSQQRTSWWRWGCASWASTICP